MSKRYEDQGLGKKVKERDKREEGMDMA